MRLKDLLSGMGDAPGMGTEAKIGKRLDSLLDVIETIPVLAELAEKGEYYAYVYRAVKSANVTDKAIVEAAVYILAGFVYASSLAAQEQSVAEQEHGLKVSCSALKAIRELQIAASVAEPDGSLLERKGEEEKTAETAETVAEEAH